MITKKEVSKCKECDQPIVEGTETLVLYFTDEQSRAEFMFAISEVMPNIKGYNIEDLPITRRE